MERHEVVVKVSPWRRQGPGGDPAYRELQRMFHQAFFPDPHAPFTSETAWRPVTDIFETEKAYVVRMELAGVQRSDFSLTFSNGVLRVEGVRQECCKHQKVALHLMEINYGAFKRSLHLPEPIDAAGIEATYEGGFLEILLPKPAPERRVIRIENE